MHVTFVHSSMALWFWGLSVLTQSLQTANIWQISLCPSSPNLSVSQRQGLNVSLSSALLVYHIVMAGPVWSISLQPCQEQADRAATCLGGTCIQGPVEPARVCARMVCCTRTMCVEAVPGCIPHKPPTWHIPRLIPKSRLAPELLWSREGGLHRHGHRCWVAR